MNNLRRVMVDKQDLLSAKNVVEFDVDNPPEYFRAIWLPIAYKKRSSFTGTSNLTVSVWTTFDVQIADPNTLEVLTSVPNTEIVFKSGLEYATITYLCVISKSNKYLRSNALEIYVEGSGSTRKYLPGGYVVDDTSDMLPDSNAYTDGKYVRISLDYFADVIMKKLSFYKATSNQQYFAEYPIFYEPV